MPLDGIELERGGHACHLYHNWAERRDVTVSFVRKGLEHHEHCMVVSDEATFGDWRRELEDAGIDVDAEERRGRLQFLTGAVWRTPLVAGGSLGMARTALALLKPLRAEFNGVRIIGDAEWDLPPSVPAAALCHWEATANVVFDDSDVRAICQYAADHYAPDHLLAPLRTHASVIYEGALHANPNDDAARILLYEPHLNETPSDPELLETALARLHRRG
ncbi:MAG TPA: MEDS domain-containing protein [Dehalococcoidia bacterium]|jgi:hypothetical protein|nr:MEDS domain-containing protein [Dehalococcoidia bacterium]